MYSLAIFKSEGGEQYHIGTVRVPMDFDESSLSTLWDEWMGQFDLDIEGPDSDSQFVDWLIQDKGFQSPLEEVSYVVLDN